MKERIKPKSNITLKSNVYINPTGRRADPEFVGSLRAYSALKQYNPSNAVYLAKLNRLQYKILQIGKPCVYEKQEGTISWGVPIGGDHLICRCEKTDCSHYAGCAALPEFERLNREPH